MPSGTVEDYVKSIFLLSLRDPSCAVSTGRIADLLTVAPGTVTSMLKTLAAAKLVHYRPYEGVELTESGRILAMRVLRRHRLLEQFLVRTLKMNWDEVHEEAELMEHSVSERLMDRIDEFLGFPKFDPHGDPIPQADGTFVPREEFRLTECDAQTRFKLVRVMNQDPAFLRYLADTGLRLDTAGVVLENRPESGVVSLAVSDSDLTIARETAHSLMVVTDL